MKARENTRITVRDIAMIGMMVAVIEVCKAAFSFLPNIELTTFWLIMFTLYFGKKVFLVVPFFILIEGTIYGFGLWWVMYIFIWPLLVFIAWRLRKLESMWIWCILSGTFGLLFGTFCTIPVILASLGDGFVNGIRTSIFFWISGIPWDIAHCVGNFVLMAVLYTPVQKVLKKMTY